MRLFSLIPALLLAVTGFSAVTPATNASNAGNGITAGNDDPIQTTISIVKNAADLLYPMSTQLSDVLATSPIDADKLSSVITQINGVVTDTTGKLQVVAPNIDFSSPDVAAAGPPVFDLLYLLQSILTKLIPVLKEILGNLPFNITILVNDLLNSVRILANFLQPFVDNLLEGIWEPVVNALYNLLDQIGNLLDFPTN